MTLPSVESMSKLAAVDPKMASIALLLAYQEALRLLGDALVEAERQAELAAVTVRRAA